jgi:hypothetical protein
MPASRALENIKSTADMKYVMKGGKLAGAMSLDELWLKTTPSGPHCWMDHDVL